MTPDTLALKRATAETIKGVGGLEAAAGFCRVGKSVLGDNQSPNRADSFVAIDVIADLEPLARERAGWPHVTQLLCQRMGGTFVALPDAPVEEVDLFAALSSLSAEFGDVTQAVCAGMADGKFCATDAREINRQLDDVIRVAASMRALCRAIEGEGR